jgi:hypothetical protein
MLTTHHKIAPVSRPKYGPPGGDFCSGSKADLTLSAGDVGSYFNNGHGVRTSIVMERSLPAIIPRTDSFATFLISARTNYILYVSLSVRRLTLSYQLAN